MSDYILNDKEFKKIIGLFKDERISGEVYIPKHNIFLKRNRLGKWVLKP